MANALSWPSQWFDTAQQWLFEALVQPLLFALGQASVLEDAYAATGWLLVGLLQLAVMLVVIAPLERWRPVEPLRDVPADRPTQMAMLETWQQRKPDSSNTKES